jgi:hypothetical protein
MIERRKSSRTEPLIKEGFTMTMEREKGSTLTLETVGKFRWGFGHKHHIETDIGNFEWSDPDHGGDNTIKPTVPYEEWCRLQKIDAGRDKGIRQIHDYCGFNVKLPK